MDTSEATRATARPPRTRSWQRSLVGHFYMWTSGIHVGIVAADPECYRPFADGAVMGWVRTGWQEVFMAAPVGWGFLFWSGPCPGPPGMGGRARLAVTGEPAAGQRTMTTGH